MDVTDEQLKMLKAIANLRKFSYPCTDDLKKQAVALVDAGFVELDAQGDPFVPDDVKWKLFAAGHVL